MIKNILLYIAIIFIVYIYIKIILKKIVNKNSIIKGCNGFDLAKEVTSNYNEINIIESKEVMINKYNIQRRLIKLTSNTYNAKDYYSLAVATLLAGYYTINIKTNKYLKILSTIIKNINYIPKIPILVVVISSFLNTVRDSKIGIVILIIFGLYQYVLLNINDEASNNVKSKLSKNLKKEEYEKLMDIILTIVKSHMYSLAVIFILLLRLMLIAFEIDF